MKRKFQRFQQHLSALRLLWHGPLSTELPERPRTSGASARSDGVSAWFEKMDESERHTRKEINRILGQRP